MSHEDHAGNPVSGASATSLAFFEQAADELRCLIGDPVASVDRAIAESPGMTMAHVLRGWLHLLGTEPSGLPVARACADSADALPANERERAHVAAIRALCDGHWRRAGQLLEDLSVRHPLDSLALQAGHQIDFFCGNSRMLRDRIARALPMWAQGIPGYHALLGMHAFGLGETGDYAQAERQGRRSVELQPRDTWAWHAVSHVHEMRNRPDEGIAWLRSNPAAWSQDSFLACHNWWHLAVFHLERDEVDEVLRLFDGPIFGTRSEVVLDLIDASALLWRLRLRGVDVGDRWHAVADRWEPIADAGNYAFNDMHAMMAFVGADRPGARDSVLEAQLAALGGDGDNAHFTREVGAAATRAILAFAEGDHAQCVRLLRPVRSYAHRFGGSHAQRDVIDLTLIEAAIRSGDGALASALAAERVALRPTSAPALRFAARAAQLARTGEPVAASAPVALEQNAA